MDERALTEALRAHHPTMRSETGPFSGCRCGGVKLGQDVIQHVVDQLRAAVMDDENATRDALNDAIRTHVAATADGAYLTDFVVIASAAMPDDPDATTYVTETSDGPLHHRLALVRYLALRSDQLMDDEGDQ